MVDLHGLEPEPFLQDNGGCGLRVHCLEQIILLVIWM